MCISQEKKDFIEKTAAGIQVYMATTYRADEIAVNAVGAIEKYIQKHILVFEKSAMSHKRWWFSETLFCKAVNTMDDATLCEMLLYLDNIDMCLCDVFVEACINTRDLTENEKKWAELIMDGKLVTFEEFLDL